MKFIVSLITFMNCVSTVTWAWGDLGHETVGEIAQQIIENDPKTKQAVQNIVGVEPYAVSATWPDHVRSDERFADFAPYHFTTVFRDPKVKSEKDAMTILQKYPDVLTSRKYSREMKMIAFRYLVHVVGDIHQPLHVGNEFDRGGNSCNVFWQQEGRSPYRTNLHSVWDTAMVEAVMMSFKKLEPEVRYYDYKSFARALVKKHHDLVSADATVDVQAWVNESDQLRASVVYPDTLADDARPYCNSNRDAVDEKDMPILGQKYLTASAPIIEKRIVLAGVRLAAFLKEIFAERKVKNKPAEAEILEMLKLDNH